MGNNPRTRQSQRILAAILSTLYVFLCTFGSLTHSHPVQGGFAATGSSSAQSAVPSLYVSAQGPQSLVPNTHCAYCDWQANSLSAALPILRMAHIPGKTSYSFPFLCSSRSRFFTFFSSRGPPVV